MNFDTMLLSCNHSQAPQIKTSTKIQKNGNYPYYHEINNTVRLNILLWSADFTGKWAGEVVAVCAVFGSAV